MTTDTSKQLNLTNNSGKDVVVTLAVTPDQTTKNGGAVSSDGILEVLKTTDGSTVIRSGASGTLTLDHSYKPGGTAAGYVHNYDLVVGDSTWLYPLATLPVTQQTGNGSSGYAPQTIGSNGASMKQAALFYQIISVYPGSGLANDYADALQAAQDAALFKADGSAGAAAAAAAAMEAAMDAFFKKTTEYGQVTLAGVVAVDNYYNAFPAVWAQYKDVCTYYLYGSDGNTAGFAGSLSLSKQGPVDFKKPNGGYTCTFAPASSPGTAGNTDVDNSKATQLTYSKGLFVDDSHAKQPNIALQGAFMPASVFSGNEEDKQLLIIVGGNTNGTVCVGFDAPQAEATLAPQAAKATATASSGGKSYWDALVHPATQQEMILSILTLIGAVLLIPAVGGAVYGVYRVVKYKAVVHEALDKQIVEYTKEEFEKIMTDDMITRTGFLEPEVGTALKDFIILRNPKNIEGYNRVVKNNMLAEKFAKALRLQREVLTDTLRYKTQLSSKDAIALDTAIQTNREGMETLDAAPRTTLETVLPEQFKAYRETTSAIMDIYFRLEGKISADVRADIIKNSDLSQGIYKNVEETFKGNEELAEEPEPDNHFDPEFT